MARRLEPSTKIPYRVLVLHDVVWRVRDLEALQRELELIAAETRHDSFPAFFWKLFTEEIQSHPFEWPSSTKPPSEHTWSAVGVTVRYRFIPDAQQVEILSMKRRRPSKEF